MQLCIHVLWLLLAVGCLAIGQEREDYLSEYPGHVTYKYQKHGARGLTSNEEGIVIGKLEKIGRYLQTIPQLAKPKGIEVVMTSELSEKSFMAPWNISVRSELQLKLFGWFMNKGKPTYHCDICAKSFRLLINQPEESFRGMSITGGDDVYDTNGYLIMTQPKVIGKQDGCEIYANSVVVIAKDDKPLWIPVTVKEFDEALIRKYQKLAKENPGEAMGHNFVIKKIKEEMGLHSEKELNSPAYTGGFGAFPAKQTDDSQSFVKLNPEYFDKTKPRTAIQLIVLESPSIAAMEDGTPYVLTEYSSFEETRFAELLKSLKYSAMKQFLD